MIDHLKLTLFCISTALGEILKAVIDILTKKKEA